MPSVSAQQLYAAAGEPRSLWIGTGMGHVMMFTKMRAEYERRVTGFFEAQFDAE